MNTKKPNRLLTEQFIGGLNDNDMTDEIFREITTLENTEEATGEHVLIWACGMAQRAQRSILNNTRGPKTLMPYSKTPRCRCMGLHNVTDANIAVQGIQPSSALHMERSVGNVEKTITSRQYEGPCRGKR